VFDSRDSFVARHPEASAWIRSVSGYRRDGKNQSRLGRCSRVGSWSSVPSRVKVDDGGETAQQVPSPRVDFPHRSSVEFGTLGRGWRLARALNRSGLVQLVVRRQRMVSHDDLVVSEMVGFDLQSKSHQGSNVLPRFSAGQGDKTRGWLVASCRIVKFRVPHSGRWLVGAGQRRC